VALLHIVRVFTGPAGTGGNPLGVFLDGAEVAPADRQSVAAELGFSETVYVTDAVRGELGIFTPAAELPLAGHPLVGTAWLLAREREAVDLLRPPAGEIPTWAESGRTWIRALPEQAPDFRFEQLGSPRAVDALEGPPAGSDPVEVWAYADESAGIVRARMFAPGLGVDEDEATGSAALRLCAALGRALEIRQGAGSVIHARPGPGRTVEVGGTVGLVERREL